MLGELLKHPQALLISVALHALVIGVMVVNLQFADRPKLIKAGEVAKTVKAEVVDNSQLEERARKQAEEAKRRQELEAQRRTEEQRKQAEAQRQAEAKRKAEEARKAEARREAEKKRARSRSGRVWFPSLPWEVQASVPEKPLRR